MGKASRNKAQRRLQRARLQQAGESALVERVRHREEGIPVIKDPAGLEKMSKVIQDFAEPLLEQGSSGEEYRAAFGIAIIAWNLSLLPEAAREQKLTQSIRPELGPQGEAILVTMVQRKLALYPDIQRQILDFELTPMGGDEFHLDVMSSPPLDKSPAGEPEAHEERKAA
jgi:hypothetical protein